MEEVLLWLDEAQFGHLLLWAWDTFWHTKSSYARGVWMGERRLGMIADWILSEPNYSYPLTERNLGIYHPN